MDSKQFFKNILSNEQILLLQNNVAEHAESFVSNLFNLNDTPRNKIQFIISLTTELIKKIFTTSLENIETMVGSKTDNLELVKY